MTPCWWWWPLAGLVLLVLGVAVHLAFPPDEDGK